MLLTEYNEKEVLELTRAEGKAEGIEEGVEIGSANTEARYNKLIELLLNDNRADDLVRAAKDKEFRDSLFKEFNLI